MEPTTLSGVFSGGADRYQQYMDAQKSYLDQAQANDPAFQEWQSMAGMYTPDMGGAPAWQGTNYNQNWWNAQTPNVQRDMQQARQEYDAQQAGSFKGYLKQAASMIPGAVLAAGAAPALGSLFGGAPEAATYGMDGLYNNPAFTSIPDASTGLVADYANPAFTAFDAPTGAMAGAYNNPAFTAMPGLEGGYITQGVGAGAGAASNGVQDFFKNIGNEIKEKPMSSLIGGARALSSLAGLYSSYAQDRDYSNLAGNMMGLFGDDSAYARQLRKELQRRDAASGRRSQYGPRAVELQAKLAELASRQAPTLANIYQQQGMNRNNMMNSGLNLLKGTGAMDWFDNIMKAPLAQLFGG